MPERYLGRIEPDMDVCDVNGDKLGSVARVYRYDQALVGRAAEGGLPPREELIEVKTGFLGLGKHLYIPLGAIQEVTSGCVFLAKTSDEVKSNEAWSAKPDYIEDLH